MTLHLTWVFFNINFCKYSFIIDNVIYIDRDCSREMLKNGYVIIKFKPIHDI